MQGSLLPCALHSIRSGEDIEASLPEYTPEVNYLVDDWYVQGEPVDDDTDLVNGQTYTIQFYPDPAIFARR